MNKTLAVLGHEILSLVSRFSFWFGVVGVPMIALSVYAGIAFLNRSQGGAGGASPALGVDFEKLLAPPEVAQLPQGYVDQAGLITGFPEGFAADSLIGYAQIEAARRALDSQEIDAFYVIPPDYLQTGKLVVYTPEFNLLDSESRSNDFLWLIEYNLLGQDIDLTRSVEHPLGEIEEVNLSPTADTARDPDHELTFILPYATMMIFFVSIMGSSSMLLNSVTKEKENRVMEILMVSTGANQLLVGKIIGLGLVGLLQVLVWGGSALTLLRLSGQDFSLPIAFQLSPSVLVWGIVFFILGYLVYATLMAGLGALVSSLREASQATTIITLPMMVPLFILQPLISSPNGPLATALSLFPLTAPSTMMLRLAATQVPTWQLALSAGLLAVTAMLVIRAVAGMFRAQTLFSGQGFQVKKYFLALIGRL